VAAPLHGIRVLDLSRVLAGPYCTMALADLGADVVKVERPGSGDETRTWGPPYAGGEAAYYLSLNRGKRSCAIDLADPEGRAAALRLAASADVVVENFKVGGAERLGLGYEDVRAVNPSVVYCSITGFGPKREPVGRTGYDFVVQAESGLMHITGPLDGEPFKVGVAVVDVLTGLNAAVAVLAALTRRERTGEGERIEVSLLDSALAALVNVGQNALVTGEEVARHGNAHPNIVPYEPFRAADGWVAVAAPNDGLFRRMCEVLGAPELADDERFATNPDRVRNREALVARLEKLFAARPAEEWLSALEAVGVPAGKIRGVREALDAAAEAGEPATVTVEHPTAGPLELIRPAFRLASSDVPASLRPPPLLGEHTDEVLREGGGE
jgi:crotonobetainyl-CoA:carnitine CoA-transferase CaiB-like acyl-CoA transferase